MHSCLPSDLSPSGSIFICRVCGKKYDITPHRCKNTTLLARYREQGLWLTQCRDCGEYWLTRTRYQEYTGDPYHEDEEITPSEAQSLIAKIRDYGGEVFDPAR